MHTSLYLLIHESTVQVCESAVSLSVPSDCSIPAVLLPFMLGSCHRTYAETKQENCLKKLYLKADEVLAVNSAHSWSYQGCLLQEAQVEGAQKKCP